MKRKKDFDYLKDVEKSIEQLSDNYEQYLSNIDIFVNELGVQKSVEESLGDSIDEIKRILKQKLGNMENDNLKFPSDDYITLISRLSEIEEECKEKKKIKLKELNKKNRKYKCNSYWLYKFRNIRESKYKRRTFKYSI